MKKLDTKFYSELITSDKIKYDFNNPETYNNILPLGLVPKTNKNIEIFNKKKDKLNHRTFITLVDIECILSDGHKITIPKGFTTDLISIPKWLWTFLSPFDSLMIGDLIHDYLYTDKLSEIERHNLNIFYSQKFADDERHRWRLKIAEHITKSDRNRFSIKNWLTNKVLRLFAKDFYIKKYSIPN